MKKLLTIPEVQELLKCSRSTVYRLINSGTDLEALKVLGSVRITGESLERYRNREILRYKENHGTP